MKLPKQAEGLIETLNRAGYEAWAVGGCVRDCILGRCPHDWDICTSAMPWQTISLFGATHRVLETGARHGTVTVMVQGEPYEVTTFRADGPYTDHRRPDTVSFGSSLQQDLARRDFTVNAMALGTGGEIIDLFGGAQDLENKLIRCVGKPQLRFNEDALRILRALRFASQLDFSIHPDTMAAAVAAAPLLVHVAAERKAAELEKLLLGPGAGRVLVQGASILAAVIPEIAPCIDFDLKSPYHDRSLWQHIADAVAAAPPQQEIRWALLLHDLAKPRCFTVDEKGIGHSYGHGALGEGMSRQVMRRLRLPKALQQQVATLVRYHDAQLPLTATGVRRWLAKLGPQGVSQLLVVKAADMAAHAPHASVQNRTQTIAGFEQLVRQQLQQQACFKVQQLAISGRDVLGEKICAPGPAVGLLLNTLLEEVIEGRLPNEKNQLLTYARKLREAESEM